MEQKHTLKNKKIIILTSIAVVSILIIGGYILFNTMKAKAEPSSEAQKPSFSFDGTKVPGWWSGDNYWSDTEEATSSESPDNHSPVVSMTVTEGTAELPGSCFVTYSYLKGSVDVDTALVAMEGRSSEGSDDVILQKLAVQPQTMNTPEGAKEYELHQYEVTGPGSGTMAKGAQFAYVPLKGGYINMRSYCEEAEELAGTLAVFSAVSFKL